ncbi:MAG TPA: hypothetical protein VIY47_05610 [Ignavibacteriaceae bacterium]
MMKKKISILTLTILFLVSTTGLPIWSHYCEMNGNRSSGDCDMCKIDIEEIESTCCSEENPFEKLQVSSENFTCCIDSFDYKKIEDNFSQPISLRLIFSSEIIGTTIDEVVKQENVKTQSYLNTHNLPPPKFGKQLLHTIHQLKIDLPIC